MTKVQGKVLIFDVLRKMGLDKSLLRLLGLIHGFADQLIKVNRLIIMLVTLD